MNTLFDKVNAASIQTTAVGRPDILDEYLLALVSGGDHVFWDVAPTIPTKLTL